MKSLRPWSIGAWLLLAVTSFATKAGLISFHTMDPLPLCLFRFWTGHPCPGCGMTRALLAAFQGQWRISYAFHPLGIPFLVVWTAWLLLSPWTPEGWTPGAPLKKLRSWAEAAALLVILLVYAVRLL